MSVATEQTIHIAVGGVLGSALAEMVSPVLVLTDSLLLGASRADAKRHQVVRSRAWGQPPSPELYEELARTSGPTIRVLFPATPGGLLGVSHICSLAIGSEREVEARELQTKDAPLHPRGVDPAEEPYLDADVALRHSQPAARWTRLEIALAATLWRLWCRRSPVALSRFCVSGAPLHPSLANLGCFHAGFFPRIMDQGLSLSRLDELILRQLSREWSTPARMLVRTMTSGSELGAWLSHTGDLYLAARLLAWSRHSRGRIVERRRERPANPADMTRWSFRWAAGGEAVLETLPSVEAAPPVAVGGAVAYAPDHPWVSRVSTAGRPYVDRAAKLYEGPANANRACPRVRGPRGS